MIEHIKKYWSLGAFVCLLAVFVIANKQIQKEEEQWVKAKGKITYVKQLDPKRFLYVLEYGGEEKVRLFKECEQEPFLGQEISLKYKGKELTTHKLLQDLKYTDRIESVGSVKNSLF